MRVAHCIHGLGLGGAQQVVREIVSRSDPEAFRFFVYAAEDGFFRSLLEEAGATVRVIPRVFRRFDPVWVYQLARAMRRDRIDLVHAHLFGDSLHGYLAARISGRTDFVVTLHCDLRFQNGLQRRGYRWLLGRQLTAVACSGASLRSIAMIRATPIRAPKTIANGVSEAPVVCGDARAKTLGRAALAVGSQEVVQGHGILRRHESGA